METAPKELVLWIEPTPVKLLFPTAGFTSDDESDYGSAREEKFVNRKKEKPSSNSGTTHRSRKRKPSASWILLVRFFRVAAAFFKGDAKWKARGLFLLMVVLCGTSTGLFVIISYTQRDFSTALSKKDKDGFYVAIWKFIGIISVATPLFAFYDYAQGLMALEWRIWLTEQLLSKYFANRSYFDLKMNGDLDNPDQRIAEDVRDFTANTVHIIIVITGKILNVAAFSGVLWSISPFLVYFLIGYSIVCVYISLRVFGRKLMMLRFESLQKEADFRYALVRVRENAESIAFYRGEGREASSSSLFFSILVRNLRERLVWGRHLSLFQNLYEYATIVIPAVIIAPKYFRGEVEFGVITQTSFAFKTILYALTFIIQRLDSLSGLAAETERLDGLLSTLSERGWEPSQNRGKEKTLAESGSKKSHDEEGGEDTPLLSIGDEGSGMRSDCQGVQRSMSSISDSVSPSPRNMKIGLSPRTKPSSWHSVGKGGSEGEPLIGRSLSSTSNTTATTTSTNSTTEHLPMRSTATEGKIIREEGPGLIIKDLCISTPNLQTDLFPDRLNVSVSPGESLLVMGPSGCGKSSLLRAIAGLWNSGKGSITSPPTSSTFFLPQKPYMPLGSLRTQLLFPFDEDESKLVRDLELLHALTLVSLPNLVERFGGLDAVQNWSDTLSMGEQQRIAFARLLVQKPAIAFLDEASSALDSKNEALIYGLVKERVRTIVSVGHRHSLIKFHSHILWHDEELGWKFLKSSEFEAMRKPPIFPTS